MKRRRKGTHGRGVPTPTLHFHASLEAELLSLDLLQHRHPVLALGPDPSKLRLKGLDLCILISLAHARQETRITELALQRLDGFLLRRHGRLGPPQRDLGLIVLAYGLAVLGIERGHARLQAVAQILRHRQLRLDGDREGKRCRRRRGRVSHRRKGEGKGASGNKGS